MTTSQGAAVIYQVFVRQYGPTGTFDDVIVDMDRIRDVAGDGAYIHILPCHPTGLLFRKGSLGSPYSIRSYKQLDPAIVGATVRANTNTGSTLPASSASSTVSTSASAAAVTPEVSGSVSSAKCTTSADGVGKFRELVECAHSKGLKIMMDVVFAHTSRDSDVVVHHPEWFYLSGGIPAPRVAEWSDVASFDWEAGGEALRAYLIDVLMYWADMGVDGFRCDVAPDIPLDFWERARKTVATKTPNMLWLGETWTLAGVEKKRRRDCPMYPADSEMCRAFDLLYDYDLYQLWRACVAGEAPVWRYFEGIRLQSATLPPGKHKIRFVETHDKDRMASLVKSKDKLLAWTAFAAFLPGPFLVYAGQESAAIKKFVMAKLRLHF
ncbi:Alpha amylase catalytic region [Pelomyxa schiedti]|nr:Alpha amylase catalytic region [Pelomyxa schiedti]